MDANAIPVQIASAPHPIETILGDWILSAIRLQMGWVTIAKRLKAEVTSEISLVDKDSPAK